MIFLPHGFEGDMEYASPGQTGSAHSVSGDPSEPDIVSQLRDVVEEVTGHQCQQVRKIGFY